MRTSVLLWLSIAMACSLSSRTSAQSTRRFAMALFPNDLGTSTPDHPDPTDLRYFTFSTPQPPGRTITGIPPDTWQSFSWPQLLALGHAPTYDWSRIVALVIDEPYLNVFNSQVYPCETQPSESCKRLVDKRGELEAIANGVHEVSPSTKFWINFSEPELGWMGYQTSHSTPRLFGDWTDIVSLDRYAAAFDPLLRDMNEFLIGQRSRASQQLALVPGTFVYTGCQSGDTRCTSYSDGNVSSFLGGYFAYADEKNQACRLPFGPAGINGNFDGCLIPFVVGYAGTGSKEVTGANLHFLRDGGNATALTRATWTQQYQKPWESAGLQLAPVTAAVAATAACVGGLEEP